MFYSDILNIQKFSAFHIIDRLERDEDVIFCFKFSFNGDKAYSELEPLINFYISKYINVINILYPDIKNDSFLYLLFSPFFTYSLCVIYSQYLYCLYLRDHRSSILQKPNIKLENDRFFKTSKNFFENIFLNENLHKWIASFFIDEKNSNEKPEMLNNNYENILMPKKNFFQLFKERNVIKKPHRLYYLIIEIVREKLYKKLKFRHIYGFGFFSELFFSFLIWVGQKKRNKVKGHNYIFPTLNCDISHMEPEFLKKVEEIIAHLFPKSFLENFTTNYNKALKKVDLSLKFDSVMRYIYSEVFEEALNLSLGKVVCMAQHGSGYTTCNLYMANATEFIVNYFFCWGIVQPPNNFRCNFFFAPSPMLSKLKNRHKNTQDHLVFVGTYINPLWDGILYCNPSGYRNYILSKKKFFDSIDKKIYHKLLYKLCPNNGLKYFDEKKFISELFPDLSILPSDCLLEKKLKTCKIVIMDHLDGTTFYKAMVCNTPIIVYDAFNWLGFFEEAKKTFNELRKVGIIYGDVIDCVDFLNNNWDTIDQWWNSVEVQSVRMNFLNKYANTSKNYYWEWIKIIINLIRK